VWQRIFEHLTAELGNEYAMIDCTIVRAHQLSARRTQKKDDDQAIGRSKGGLSTKIHAFVDALGYPLRFLLTPGQAHDLTGADALLPQMAAEVLIARQSLRCRRSRPQAAGRCRKIRRHPASAKPNSAPSVR
jgi:hypothetical protein